LLVLCIGLSLDLCFLCDRTRFLQIQSHIRPVFTNDFFFEMYSLKCVSNDPFKCMHSCFDFALLFYNRVVQPCRHLSHVATGHLNVATGSFSRISLIVKKLTKLLFISYFSLLWRQQRLCRHKVSSVATRNTLVGQRCSTRTSLGRYYGVFLLMLGTSSFPARCEVLKQMKISCQARKELVPYGLVILQILL